MAISLVPVELMMSYLTAVFLVGNAVLLFVGVSTIAGVSVWTCTYPLPIATTREGDSMN